MDPPAYVQQGAVDLLHVFQVSLSCWPYAAPPSADDMLAVEIALRDTLAGEAAANARSIAPSAILTSINTLSYADVPSNMLSRATSLTAMAQQLSQSMGVAAGAMFLYLMLALHGEKSPGPSDFSFALAAVATLSVLGVPFFLRMSPEAGAEVSGRAAGGMRGKMAGE